METQRKILAAAKEVFSSVPFRAAGIRTIAKAAGVRHPLVLHYYQSKEALFEEVTKELANEILKTNPLFLAQLSDLPKEHRGAFFIQGAIRQGFMQQHTYKLMLVNVGDAKNSTESLPGIERITSALQKSQAIVGLILGEKAYSDQAVDCIVLLTLIVMHFVGGRKFHQKALGIASSHDYEKWVENACLLIFEPLVKDLASGRTPRAPAWPGLSPRQEVVAPEIKTSAASPSSERGEKTRAKIIKAAKKVFSTHSYDSATIRMIGEAGGFDYSRIHHFYPRKAKLFEAVTQDILKNFFASTGSWHRDFTDFTFDEMYHYYLATSLSYCFISRDILGILVRNIANFERFENLPGLVEMATIHSNMVETMRNIIPEGISQYKLNQWFYALVVAIYSLTGAPDYPAGYLKIDPATEAYRERIFQSLYLSFKPSLDRLLDG